MKKLILIPILLFFFSVAYSQVPLSSRDAVIMFNDAKGKDIQIPKDTINFRIDHTAYCLQNFRREQLVGIATQIGGGCVMAISAFSKVEEIMYVGGVMVLTGFIFQMRSYRWLNQAYVYPIENGLSVGIKLKF